MVNHIYRQKDRQRSFFRPRDRWERSIVKETIGGRTNSVLWSQSAGPRTQITPLGHINGRSLTSEKAHSDRSPGRLLPERVLRPLSGEEMGKYRRPFAEAGEERRLQNHLDRPPVPLPPREATYLVRGTGSLLLRFGNAAGCGEDRGLAAKFLVKKSRVATQHGEYLYPLH